MVEAVHVPVHLAPPGSLQAKQLCHLHTQPSLGQGCHRQKSLASMHAGLLQLYPILVDPVQWPARLLCQRGSPCKNTGVYWPILVVIPFWSTIFPAALATNSPEYLVLPKHLQPKQLHHLHTWPSLGQTQVLQSSPSSKPQWTTRTQRWK